MMASLQQGGALHSDYFTIISKVSPHDKVFKYHQEIEELGLYGVQVNMDERERDQLKESIQINLEDKQIEEQPEDDQAVQNPQDMMFFEDIDEKYAGQI